MIQTPLRWEVVQGRADPEGTYVLVLVSINCLPCVIISVCNPPQLSGSSGSGSICCYVWRFETSNGLPSIQVIYACPAEVSVGSVGPGERLDRSLRCNGPRSPSLFLPLFIEQSLLE